MCQRFAVGKRLWWVSDEEQEEVEERSAHQIC